VLDGLAASNSGDNAAVEAKVRGRIHDLCERFPIYGKAPLAAAAE
jgi:glycine hydroxymethyltransferase